MTDGKYPKPISKRKHKFVKSIGKFQINSKISMALVVKSLIDKKVYEATPYHTNFTLICSEYIYYMQFNLI